MSLYNPLAKRLILFNILVALAYIAIVSRGFENPNALDIVLLMTLPIASYILLKKQYDSYSD